MQISFDKSNRDCVTLNHPPPGATHALVNQVATFFRIKLRTFIRSKTCVLIKDRRSMCVWICPTVFATAASASTLTLPL